MFELDIVRLLKGTGLNDMRLVGMLQDVVFVFDPFRLIVVIAEQSAKELLDEVSILIGDARLMDTLIMSKLFPFSSGWTGRMMGLAVGTIVVCIGTNEDKSDLETHDDKEAVDEIILDGTIVRLHDCGDEGGVVQILDENWFIILELFEFSTNLPSHDIKFG